MNYKQKKKARLKRFETLKRKWDNCTKCKLHKNRKNVVYYRGNPCAKIMIIGEAPGANEDEKGIPFVGEAGEVLDDIISMTDFNSKKDFIIVNTVGCRPPRNKDPSPKDVLICRPRLEKIFDIVKPKVVILMGLTAAKNLAGIMSLKNWKNRIKKININDQEYKVISTYHPAYYFYGGRRKEIKLEIKKAFDVAWRIVNVKKEKKE